MKKDIIYSFIYSWVFKCKCLRNCKNNQTKNHKSMKNMQAMQKYKKAMNRIAILREQKCAKTITV